MTWQHQRFLGAAAMAAVCLSIYLLPSGAGNQPAFIIEHQDQDLESVVVGDTATAFAILNTSAAARRILGLAEG